MSQIQEQFSLKSLNTFGIDVTAKYYISVRTKEDFQDLDLSVFDKYLVLGGGSNMLFTSDYEGLIIHNEIKGRQLVEEDDQQVLVVFGAGENWHDTVLWTVEKGWGGLENLSLIPGSVGAAPVQNIGAYGVALKDVCSFVEAIDMDTKEVRRFSNEDCQFDYRDSIFKKVRDKKYFITQVGIRLQKDPKPQISYGGLKALLDEWGAFDPTTKQVSDAVIQIRQSKLPDPSILGNAGSFFKNPIIARTQFEELLKKYPDMVHYPISDQRVKIPAGWLIEQCGWKGRHIGQAGCHDRQALVLVNLGRAEGMEILNLSRQIQDSVESQFGIKLDREVSVF